MIMKIKQMIAFSVLHFAKHGIKFNIYYFYIIYKNVLIKFILKVFLMKNVYLVTQIKIEKLISLLKNVNVRKVLLAIIKN